MCEEEEEEEEDGGGGRLTSADLPSDSLGV